MRVKTFFMLLLCVLQGVHGSNSKNKGRKSKKLFKTCLIILAANEISNGRNRQWRHVSDSNALACKYTVPEQNAAVMMNFAICAKEPGFEKYLIQNSENCSKVKKLYEKAKSAVKCVAKVPKIIVKGVLAKFRGEQLRPKTNVKMMKAYLNPEKNPEVSLLFGSETIASGVHQHFKELLKTKIGKEQIKKDLQFFRFTHALELIKEVYSGDMGEKFVTALGIALHGEIYDGDADLKHVKAILEFTKLRYPENENRAVLAAFNTEFKDVNVDHVKRLFELTQLMYPDNLPLAAKKALHPKYKYINIDRVYKKYQDVKNSWSQKLSEKEIMEKTFEFTYPEIIKENF